MRNHNRMRIECHDEATFNGSVVLRLQQPVENMPVPAVNPVEHADCHRRVDRAKRGRVGERAYYRCGHQDEAPRSTNRR